MTRHTVGTLRNVGDFFSHTKRGIQGLIFKRNSFRRRLQGPTQHVSSEKDSTMYGRAIVGIRKLAKYVRMRDQAGSLTLENSTLAKLFDSFDSPYISDKSPFRYK